MKPVNTLFWKLFHFIVTCTVVLLALAGLLLLISKPLIENIVNIHLTGVTSIMLAAILELLAILIADRVRYVAHVKVAGLTIWLQKPHFDDGIWELKIRITPKNWRRTVAMKTAFEESFATSGRQLIKTIIKLIKLSDPQFDAATWYHNSDMDPDADYAQIWLTQSDETGPAVKDCM